MKTWKNGFVASILVFLLAGCSAKQDLIVPSPEDRDLILSPSEKQDLIVLLPDPEGKVGTIHVTTEGGSQTLEKPWYGTRVEDFSKPPTAPKPLGEKEITTVFGQALSDQPDPTGRFVSFILYFESDTSILTHESKEVLPEVVRTIKDRKSKEVYVVGHTDRVGAELYNRGLSSRRANYVRDQFVIRGIQSSDLVVSFHGEAMPLVKTEDEVPEPLNRRVEVIVR